MTTDYRKMFDESPYVAAHDLDKEVTVTIESVTQGELVGEGGVKNKKPLIHLRGATKPWAACKTDCRKIHAFTGTNDTSKWVGVKVLLFATTCSSRGGNIVDCVRCTPKELPE